MIGTHELDTTFPLERLVAHRIVRMSGFPLWRRLVDRAIALTNQGMTAADAASFIARNTKRLPR